MAKPTTPSERRLSPERAFGRVLREARVNHRLSQEELAARSGYHRTYIGQLERGEKSPSLRTLFALAGTLNVSPAEIIQGVQHLSGGGILTAALELDADRAGGLSVSAADVRRRNEVGSDHFAIIE